MSASQSSKNISTAPWWKNVVCYEVWPKSFMDGNGDGYGDIKGLISKLWYLRDRLCVDVVWLCPMYMSPMKDEGYDISDYQAIHPKFGTMQTMVGLIEEVHKKGMKILLDLVITHTSNEHPWFLESKSSRTNPKHDWYIWRDRRTGNCPTNPKDTRMHWVEEPTNWQASFGGSTWTFIPERNQYYLGLFSRNQPDLNWEKKEVREAIYETIIGFWLDKDVDGFRIDSVNRISKDQRFPDAPWKVPGLYQPGAEFYMNGPRVHEFLQEMTDYMKNHKSIRSSGKELMLVGELPATSEEEVLRYVHPLSEEMNMVFDFDVIKLGNHDDPEEFKPHQHNNLCDGDKSLTLRLFKEKIEKVQLLPQKGGWGTVFLENHDQCRSIQRFATPKPEYHALAAKLLCLLQTTLTGTQFIYQGQEIGMLNMPSHWRRDDFRDQGALKYIEEEFISHGIKGRERALEATRKFGRDNARTPFQWDSTMNAGFSTGGYTWIGVNNNKDTINFRDQWNHSCSIFHFWREMILFRKSNFGKEVFMHGTFKLLDRENQNTFTYLKSDLHRPEDPHCLNNDLPTLQGYPVSIENGTPRTRHALVCLNFSDKDQALSTPADVLGELEVKLFKTNYMDVPQDLYMPLRPWEGRLYLLKTPFAIEPESP